MKTLPLTYSRQNVSNEVSMIFTLTVFSDINLNKKSSSIKTRRGWGRGRQFPGCQVTYYFLVHNF